MLLALMSGFARFALDLLLIRRKADQSLRLEVLALRHQLRVLERQVGRPRWRNGPTGGGCSQRVARQADHELLEFTRQPRPLALAAPSEERTLPADRLHFRRASNGSYLAATTPSTGSLTAFSSAKR